MSDDWDFYPLRVDDRPASIFVDLGLRPSAPLDGFVWLGYVRVSMRRPAPDGLSSGEEFSALSALEDDLCKRITLTRDTIYTGRNTSNGNRDFFFYTEDEDQFIRAANSAIRRFPEYQCEIGTKPDADWNTYLPFLHPSRRSMQIITNRRLCETLERNGDRLKAARDIDHRTYFHNGVSARRYGDWLRRLNFRIIALERVNDTSRFFVDFVRSDRPDQMDAVCLELLDKALESGGDYDGWKCEGLVAPEEEP